MSSILTRPDWSTAIADLQRRLAALERRLTPKMPAMTAELVFSYAGALVSATESPPKLFVVPANLGLLAVAFTSGEAGSTDTILEVKKNGSVAGTVTVPASTETYTASVAVAFVIGDTISLNVATAGTGAADMTATARFT